MYTHNLPKLPNCTVQIQTVYWMSIISATLLSFLKKKIHPIFSLHCPVLYPLIFPSTSNKVKSKFLSMVYKRVFVCIFKFLSHYSPHILFFQFKHFMLHDCSLYMFFVHVIFSFPEMRLPLSWRYSISLSRPRPQMSSPFWNLLWKILILNSLSSQSWLLPL